MNWGRELEAKIPGAPDFKYKELIKSDTAIRKGIVNCPNEIQWQHLERMAQTILQPVREEFGPLRVTSAFRCPELCLAIGSTAKSTHTFGWAADFEPFYSTDVRLFTILEWVFENLEFDTLIAEYFPEGWIHCTYAGSPERKRHRLKLKDPTHNYDLVSMGNMRQLYG